MDALEFTKDELSFAFLVYSYSLACQCLFDFVVDSVKATNPDDWKKTLCVGLGERFSQHANLCLDANLPMTDIFFVCKLLRFRINHYNGLSDVRQKERFCLQVHGVETARHWVFHGDQKVSAREVRSSVIVLSTILKTLSFNNEGMASVADKLSLLVDQVEELVSPNANQRYILSTDTIVSTMVYKGLAELKKNFEKMFTECQISRKGIVPKGKVLTVRRSIHDDFSSLFKQIKAGIMKEPKRKGCRKGEVVRMCDSVSKARNKLAHNPPFALAAAKKTLGEIYSLLEYFHLSSIMTKAAIKIIAHLEGRDKDSHVCILLSQGRHDQLEDRERILRPTSDLVIGRQEEVFAMQTAFAGEHHFLGQKILLYGPSGIGKSYLASHVAKSLSLRYKKQAWLSCSTVQELKQDISTAFSGIQAPPESTEGDQLSRVPVFSQEEHNDLQRLLVLDDVCSATMATIPKIIGNKVPALITTRSTVVKHFLQENFRPLDVIELKPFSSADSWDLIEEKVQVSDLPKQTVATIENVLDKMLENLPLCVSIYSSWLAVVEKKKRQKCSDFCHEHSKFGEYGCKITSGNWAEIEAGFGNPLHVRGLTGVVQAAEGYLEDHPLVVFLLAKICIVDHQKIPWEVISKSYRWTAYDIEPCKKRLVVGVLGVLDWLFSESGQETLVLCRDALEELGLIQWKISTAHVYLHGLTMQSIRQLLASRNYFTSSLLAYSTKKSRKSCEEIKTRPVEVCQYISEELLLQVFSRGIVLLRKLAANQLKEKEVDAVKIYIFPFLSKLIGKAIPDRSARLKRAQHFLAETLMATQSEKVHDLFPHFDDINLWAEIYQERPEDKQITQKFRIYQCVAQAVSSASKCLGDQTSGHLEERLLPLLEDVYGRDSLEVAHCHCQVAFCEQLSKGPKAKRNYLAKAAQKCPRLLYEPNQHIVRREIQDHLRKGPKNGDDLFNLWDELIVFQIQDNMKAGHCSNPHVAETALLLITLRQLRQRLFLERLTLLQERADRESLRMNYCWCFLRQTMQEKKLWCSLRHLGRALRCIKNIKSLIPCLMSLPEGAAISIKVWNAFKELCEWEYTLYFHLGHFSQSTEYFPELIKSAHSTTWELQHGVPTRRGDKTQPAMKDIFSSTEFAIRRENTALKRIKQLSITYCQLSTFYVDMDASGAMKSSISILLDSSPDYEIFKYSIMHLLSAVKFCRYCSEAEKQEVISTWEKSCQSVASDPFVKGELQKLRHPVKQAILSRVDPDRNCVLAMRQSRDCFAAVELRNARANALKCWKIINQDVGLFKKAWDACPLPYFGFDLVFVLQTAKLLEQIYSSEERYCAADWFAKFCFQYSKEMRLIFFAAKYGVEYAKFLKERGRQSEAVEQCRLLHRGLEEDLGDDYLEWLPDTSKAAQMLEDMETENDENEHR